MATTKPASTRLRTVVDRFGRFGDEDGAHSAPIPVVGCPYAMIGHPPSGGAPLGAKTVPVTVVRSFVTPDVDVQVRFAATDLSATSLRSSVGKVVASRSVPGPDPL